MAQLDLQFQRISKAELETVLSQLDIQPNTYKLSESKGASGDVFMDLALELSKIDLNALSLLVGYALGKGVSVYQFLRGKRTKIDTLSDARTELIDKSRTR
jgi:hypothetical protein